MVNIWDPHFHIWDVSEVTQSGHDPAQLFAPKEDPVYTIDRYENDMACLNDKNSFLVFESEKNKETLPLSDLLQNLYSINSPLLEKGRAFDEWSS